MAREIRLRPTKTASRGRLGLMSEVGFPGAADEQPDAAGAELGVEQSGREGLLVHLRRLEENGALTPTGLSLPDDIPYERWEALVEFFARVKRATPWWIGDLLNFGERVYGEDYTQACDITGLGRDTLYNYVSIAKAIPP